MITSEQVDLVDLIITREKACHTMELTNRAYFEFGILSYNVRSAYEDLKTQKKVIQRKITAPDIKRTDLSFLCSRSFPMSDINDKAKMLAGHYDLRDEVGRHGEYLVASACEDLGYTDIEVRKEKQNSQDLGMIEIRKRDIDVWVLHPSGEHYQNIEMKNRRQPVNEADIRNLLETSAIAGSRWALKKPIMSALVTPFVDIIRANSLGVPVAISDGVYVPEKHRVQYEERRATLRLLSTQ